MSCGARLPVYSLLLGAFFKPEIAGNLLFLIYSIGILFAVLIALILRKIVFRGKTSPFVMELPPYRMPTPRGIITHIWEKSWMYIKKAGTIILAVSIIVWFLTSFPKSNNSEEHYKKFGDSLKVEMSKNKLNDEQIQKLVNSKIEIQKSSDNLSSSFAGIVGKIIEPVIKPLGFDWKIGIALIVGFSAKEIVVSTLGTIYKVENSGGDEKTGLREALQRDKKVFNPLVALALMIFVLLYVPCIATLSVIYKELGKIRWVLFAIFVNTGAAYLAAFAVYNGGKLLGF